MKSRVVSLDYVRGLAAFGIMLYHYQSWSFGHMDATSFWGRIGLYGVAIFYVLSGLTLYHVYEKRLTLQLMPLIDFYLKRIFRLMPLLWLIMGIYLITEPSLREWDRILLNYTGLFGLLAWDKPIGVGVWSIGNELAFYICFPIFVFTAKYSKAAFTGICFLIVAIGAYFAFARISATAPLEQSWQDYVNPLNQLFLFLGGVTIGYFFKYKEVSNLFAFIFMLVAAAVFTYYPANGETSVLVANINRFIFSACCLAVCFSMYKLPLSLPEWVNLLFQKLGEISYALYLIHPLVYNELVKPLKLQPWTAILLASLITITISMIVYHFYEKAFIRMGQNTSGLIAKRLSSNKVS
jgi:exopolysaccharide production protein ExoZ